MRLTYSISIFIIGILCIHEFNCQLSVFDVTEVDGDNDSDKKNVPNSNQPVDSNSTYVSAESNNANGLDHLIQLAKQKISNPKLKQKFTPENVANILADFLSGNSFLNNLEVKEETTIKKAVIKDNLKVKNEAFVNQLDVREFHNKVINFSNENNEIEFDPDSIIKIKIGENKKNNIAFKTQDLFESITFFKYIIKICGNRLERCDLGNLLKENRIKKEKAITSSNKLKKEIKTEKSEKYRKVDSDIVTTKNYNFLQKNEKKSISSNAYSLDLLEIDRKLNEFPSYAKFLSDPVVEKTLTDYYYGNNNYEGI